MHEISLQFEFKARTHFNISLNTCNLQKKLLYCIFYACLSSFSLHFPFDTITGRTASPR